MMVNLCVSIHLSCSKLILNNYIIPGCPNAFWYFDMVMLFVGMYYAVENDLFSKHTMLHKYIYIDQ